MTIKNQNKPNNSIIKTEASITNVKRENKSTGFSLFQPSGPPAPTVYITKFKITFVSDTSDSLIIPNKYNVNSFDKIDIIGKNTDPYSNDASTHDFSDLVSKFYTKNPSFNGFLFSIDNYFIPIIYQNTDILAIPVEGQKNTYTITFDVLNSNLTYNSVSLYGSIRIQFPIDYTKHKPLSKCKLTAADNTTISQLIELAKNYDGIIKNIDSIRNSQKIYNEKYDDLNSIQNKYVNMLLESKKQVNLQDSNLKYELLIAKNELDNAKDAFKTIYKSIRSIIPAINNYTMHFGLSESTVVLNFPFVADSFIDNVCNVNLSLFPPKYTSFFLEDYNPSFDIIEDIPEHYNPYPKTLFFILMLLIKKNVINGSNASIFSSIPRINDFDIPMTRENALLGPYLKTANVTVSSSIPNIEANEYKISLQNNSNTNESISKKMYITINGSGFYTGCYVLLLTPDNYNSLIINSKNIATKYTSKLNYAIEPESTLSSLTQLTFQLSKNIIPEIDFGVYYIAIINPLSPAALTSIPQFGINGNKLIFGIKKTEKTEKPDDFSPDKFLLNMNDSTLLSVRKLTIVPYVKLYNSLENASTSTTLLQEAKIIAGTGCNHSIQKDSNGINMMFTYKNEDNLNLPTIQQIVYEPIKQRINISGSGFLPGDNTGYTTVQFNYVDIDNVSRNIILTNQQNLLETNTSITPRIDSSELVFVNENTIRIICSTIHTETTIGKSLLQIIQELNVQQLCVVVGLHFNKGTTDKPNICHIENFPVPLFSVFNIDNVSPFSVNNCITSCKNFSSLQPNLLVNTSGSKYTEPFIIQNKVYVATETNYPPVLKYYYTNVQSPNYTDELSSKKFSYNPTYNTDLPQNTFIAIDVIFKISGHSDSAYNGKQFVVPHVPINESESINGLYINYAGSKQSSNTFMFNYTTQTCDISIYSDYFSRQSLQSAPNYGGYDTQLKKFVQAIMTSSRALTVEVSLQFSFNTGSIQTDIHNISTISNLTTLNSFTSNTKTVIFDEYSNNDSIHNHSNYTTPNNNHNYYYNSEYSDYSDFTPTASNNGFGVSAPQTQCNNLVICEYSQPPPTPHPLTPHPPTPTPHNFTPHNFTQTPNPNPSPTPTPHNFTPHNFTPHTFTQTPKPTPPHPPVRPHHTDQKIPSYVNLTENPGENGFNNNIINAAIDAGFDFIRSDIFFSDNGNHYFHRNADSTIAIFKGVAICAFNNLAFYVNNANNLNALIECNSNNSYLSNSIIYNPITTPFATYTATLQQPANGITFNRQTSAVKYMINSLLLSPSLYELKILIEDAINSYNHTHNNCSPIINKQHTNSLPYLSTTSLCKYILDTMIYFINDAKCAHKNHIIKCTLPNILSITGADVTTTFSQQIPLDTEYYMLIPYVDIANPSNLNPTSLSYLDNGVPILQSLNNLISVHSGCVELNTCASDTIKMDIVNRFNTWINSTIFYLISDSGKYSGSCHYASPAELYLQYVQTINSALIANPLANIITDIPSIKSNINAGKQINGIINTLGNQLINSVLSNHKKIGNSVLASDPSRISAAHCNETVSLFKKGDMLIVFVAISGTIMNNADPKNGQIICIKELFSSSIDPNPKNISSFKQYILSNDGNRVKPIVYAIIVPLIDNITQIAPSDCNRHHHIPHCNDNIVLNIHDICV